MRNDHRPAGLTRRRHPPDDDKAAAQYAAYLAANDPDHPSNWHDNRLDCEPDFPTEAFDQ